jgi:YVTN family beta-propeller protein
MSAVMTAWCASLACVAGAPVASAASAAPATSLTAGPATVLGISGYSDMVADPVHGHVFVAAGYDSTYIAVLTTNSGALGKIPVGRVTGLALSPDSKVLYAASSDGNQIVAINTTTLAVTARYSTGSLQPAYLAFAGGSLWFSAVSTLALGRLNVSSGQVTVTSTQAPDSDAELVSSPAAPDMLVAGTLLMSPAVVDVFDVSSGTPKYVSGTANLPEQNPCNGGIGGFAISQNGQDAILSCDSSDVSAYTLSSFAPAGAYNTAPADFGEWVAVSPTGQIAVGACIEDGTSALDVFNSGNPTPVAHAVVPDYLTDGVAWDGASTLYAVSSPTVTGPFTLREYTT